MRSEKGSGVFFALNLRKKTPDPFSTGGRLVSGLLLALVLAGCASGRGGTAATPAPSQPAGLQILEAACTTCHDLGGVERLAGFNSRDDWEDIVRSMVDNGAVVTDAQIPVLVDYLTETYAVRDE